MLKGFIVGLASLGAVVGYFVAFSASPVIGILLPLLFGLLGGGGLFALVKVDLTKQAAKEKLNLAGWSMAAFSVALVITSALGLWYRDSHGVRTDQVAMFQGLTVDQAIGLAAQRKALRTLDVSAEEESAILDAFRIQLSTQAASEPARLDALVAAMTGIATASSDVVRAIDAAHLPAPDPKDDSAAARWDIRLKPLLQLSAATFPRWAKETKDSHAAPTSSSRYLHFLTGVVEDYVGNQNAVPTTNLEILSAYPDALESLLRLEDALVATENEIDALSALKTSEVQVPTTGSESGILDRVLGSGQQSSSNDSAGSGPRYFAVVQ